MNNLSDNAVLGVQMLVNASEIGIRKEDVIDLIPVFEGAVEYAGITFRDEAAKNSLMSWLWLAYKMGQEKPYMKFG